MHPTLGTRFEPRGPAPPPAPAVPVAPPEPAAVRLRSAALGLEARRAFGPLLPLIDAPEIQDLLLQADRGAARLWADRGGALEELRPWTASAEAVQRLAVALIAAGGRHLDELHPCADVRLGDGIRVHAVLPPVAVGGAAVSIRLPRADPPRLEELAARGMCDDRTLAWLREAVRERRNLLITGGTGTGKTTLLAALLDLVPRTERIITIEDLAELRVAHPHRIALEARQPNAEGTGEVSLDRLLREALRMRPDRLVLGECRGAELATMLAALNTGHDGGAATLHASRLAGVPARLEALGALAGMPPAALARQAASALHGAVHLERSAAGVRRIASVARFRLSGDGIETVAVR